MTVLVQQRVTTGDIIRFKRHAAGLSARALSIKAGLSPAYVCKVENGSIEPSLRGFARLAVALSMTKAELWVCINNEANV